MTLEEKINRHSRYEVKFNPTAGNNFLYKDGNIISVEQALDDINNLLGVMEELKEALKGLEPFCDVRLNSFSQWREKHSVVVYQFNSETITTHHLEQIKQALSKYNELFKK